MKTITPQELCLRLAAQPDLALIDMRTPVEFGATGMGFLPAEAPWDKRRPA